jgi:electron transport complex protein RnfG
MNSLSKSYVISCICGLILGSLAAPVKVRAQVFWTPQALLKDHFKRSDHVGFVKVPIEPATRTQLQTRLGRELPKREYTIFVAKTREHVDGYAMFDEQLGQHEPISFATFFDPAGHVTRVEVVAYREPYGGGIRAERYRKQFIGRDAKSGYRSGEDIDIVSGATISSRSMCIAVERAALILAAALKRSGDGSLAAR